MAGQGEFMQFQNKKIVVVGGSSGIGYATAAMVKAEGAEVVIASRPGERLETAAKQLGVKPVAGRLFRSAAMMTHSFVVGS